MFLRTFRRWSPCIAQLALLLVLNLVFDGPALAEQVRLQPRLVKLPQSLPVPGLEPLAIEEALLQILEDLTSLETPPEETRLAALPSAPPAIRPAGSATPLPSKLPEAEAAPSALPPPPSLPGMPAASSAPAAPQPLAPPASTPSPDAVALLSGWNLISLPKQPDSVDPATVLASMSGSYQIVHAYDACSSDPWRTYDPANPAESSLTAIDHRMGLWVRATAAATLAVSGTEPAETSIQLCQGWNLIGYPLAQPRPVLAALSSIAGRFQRVYGWDPADTADPWEVFDVAVPAWANDLERMLPGRGYWIYATEDTTLVLSNAGLPPEVEITAPAEAASVTTFTDVIGTVRSNLLESWELSYRRQGEGEFQPFTTGNTPVINARLGTFDPTLLLNGLYELKLSAQDVQGQSSEMVWTVVVEGQLKLGQFTLPFLDYELPVVGLPIQVVRTYDSRDKQKGDFGIGWRLSLSDVTLRENGEAGLGYEGVPSGSGLGRSYCINPSRAHIVSVVYPDGRVERFQPVYTPQCQLFAPPQVVSVEYVPLGRNTSRLEALGYPRQALVVGSFPGHVELWDQDNVTPYDPERYRVTNEDGVSYLVEDRRGLLAITDANGNTLQLDHNGITGPNAIGISFIRDGQDRITQITDPAGHSLRYAYDANGDLTSVTDQNGEITRFEYIQNHYLSKVIDPDGRETLAAEYGGDGRLIRSCDLGQCNQVIHDIAADQETVVDASGRRITYTYDEQGRIRAVKDGLGNTSLVEHDAAGNVLSVTDPNGNTTRATYDGRGNRLSVTQPHRPGEDPADFTTAYIYDARDQLTSIKMPEGAEVRLSWDAKGNLAAVRDEAGKLFVGFSYDAAGNVLSEAGPFGAFEYTTFNSFGQPQRLVDSLGKVTTASYDATGRLSGYSEPGVTANFSYDNRGRELTADYGNGVSLQYGYGNLDRWTTISGPAVGGEIERKLDAAGRLQGWRLSGGANVDFDLDPAGRLLRENHSDGTFSTYRYDAAGRVESVGNSSGASTAFKYDPAGNVVEQRDSLGHPTTFTYNPRRQVETVTDAQNHTTTFRYTSTQTTIRDPLGRETTLVASPHGLPIETRYPDGTSTRVEYLLSSTLVDAEEYPTLITDEAGRSSRFEYNPSGQLTLATDLADNPYEYIWDDDGNLSEIRSPSGVEQRLTWDLSGDVASVTYPDGGIERFVQGAAGQASRHILPSGTEVAFTYDAAQRLARRAASTGEVESYVWQPEGRLREATGAAGTTRFQYDLGGRLAKIEQGNGATVEYGYDTLDRLTLVRMRLSAVSTPYETRYSYDAVGNLVEVIDPLGGHTLFEYDAVHRLTRRELPNGVVTTFTYDARDRPLSITHRNAAGVVLRSVAYERLPGGEPSKVTFEDGSSVELRYDGALRLIEEKFLRSDGSAEETVLYSYNAAGDRLTRTDASGTRNYTYLPGHRLQHAAGPDGPESYGYDADGRLTSMSRQSGQRNLQYDFMARLKSVSDGNGATLASYIYDAEGRRIASGSGAGSRRFVIAPVIPEGGLENLHLIADASGGLLSGFVYAGDVPLLRFGANGPTYYLSDEFGSVLGLADSAGVGVARFEYDGYGRLREASGSGQALPGQLGGDFRFHGSWLESATNLYHLRARDYDPETGVFLTRDPVPPDIEQPETIHPYLFAKANPRVFIDPTGEEFSLPALNVQMAVQGVLNAIRGISVRQLLRHFAKKIAEFGMEWVLNSIIEYATAPLAEFLGPLIKPLDFERALLDEVCKVFPSSFWIEPAVKEDGKPETNGLSCGEHASGGKPPKPKGFARPDFIFSNRAPRAMRRHWFDSWLIGDLKISMAHAYHTWKYKQKKQRNAIKNHASDYGVYVALLIALRVGQKGKLAGAVLQKKLDVLFFPVKLETKTFFR